MHILIPTYGRAYSQHTWTNLPESLRSRTKLVVQCREAELYTPSQVVVLPPAIQDIAKTRQYILQNYGPKVVMLDDDLTFATRRDDDPEKFYPASRVDIADMFSNIERVLDRYVHVGVAGREGGNRRTVPNYKVGRMMRILAYNTDMLSHIRVGFGRVELMEDFDLTLQLLRKGYPNFMINWIVHDQKGSNAEGGCSTYRTPERQEAAARRLADLHPEFVTVVKKTTKTAWGGGERYDVRIQWQKAYQSSGNTSLLDTGEGADSSSKRDGSV